MDKLEKAKEIIKDKIVDFRYGLFSTRNIVGDTMTNIYNDHGLQIDVCHDYGYFEVFGLADDEFFELREYYESLLEEL